MRSRNSGSLWKWWDVNIALDETPHVICLWFYGFAKSPEYASCKILLLTQLNAFRKSPIIPPFFFDYLEAVHISLSNLWVAFTVEEFILKPNCSFANTSLSTKVYPKYSGLVPPFFSSGGSAKHR
jgi:hypothetical protein